MDCEDVLSQLRSKLQPPHKLGYSVNSGLITPWAVKLLARWVGTPNRKKAADCHRLSLFGGFPVIDKPSLGDLLKIKLRLTHR